MRFCCFRADKQGYWQSVTGSLEPQESLMKQQEEVFEETGINPDQYKIQDWNLNHEYEICRIEASVSTKCF